MSLEEIRRFECASGRPSSFLAKRLHLIAAWLTCFSMALGSESHIYANDGSYLKESQACLTAMFEHCGI
jgi:hypothetical protein